MSVETMLLCSVIHFSVAATPASSEESGQLNHQPMRGDGGGDDGGGGDAPATMSAG